MKHSPAISMIDAATLQRWRTAQTPLALIDVREPSEYQAARLSGSVLCPLGTLGQRMRDLPRDRPLVVICHAGHRAERAAQAMRAAGHANIHVLAGGLTAWARARLPLEQGA